MCIIEDISAGILLPCPESDYSILPLIGPLAHLLVGKDGYFLIYSKTANWPEIYEKLCKSPSTERWEHLKSLHPYGILGSDGNIKNFANRRDSTLKYNIVFSRLRGESELKPDARLRGVIVDTGPPRNRLEIEKFRDFIEHAERENVPIVILLSNVKGPYAKELVDRRFPIYCNRMESGGPEEKYLRPQGIGIVYEQEDFLSTYQKYSKKVRNQGEGPDISFVSIPGASSLCDLYDSLNALLISIDREAPTPLVSRVAAYASHLESIIRNMWTTINIYNKASQQYFKGEPLYTACNRFQILARRLYENNVTAGPKAIDFQSKLLNCVDILEHESTPKSVWLEQTLDLHKESDHNLVFCNYGRAQQIALNVALEPHISAGKTVYSVTPYNFSKMYPQEEMIFSGVPLNAQTFALFTSTAKRICVLCYPWEEAALHRRVSLYRDEMRKAVCSRDAFIGAALNRPIKPSFVKGIDGQVKIPGKKSSLPKGIGERQAPAVIEVGTLLDHLEKGEAPGGENDHGAKRIYNDSGTGTRWLIKTDGGNLFLSEDRSMIVVHRTYTDQKPPALLAVGDIILVGRDFNPRPMADYVWDILARRGLAKEGAVWHLWKMRLKEHLESNPTEDYRTVFNSLKEIGEKGIETPAAVYAWLNSKDLIGPHRKETLTNIGKLLGANQVEIDIWWASICQVRSVLRSAYMHLWRLTRHYASNIMMGEADDIRISPELNIWLSDLAELISFAKVISAPQRIDHVGEENPVES
jgi:hypothetical protein